MIGRNFINPLRGRVSSESSNFYEASQDAIYDVPGYEQYTQQSTHGQYPQWDVYEDIEEGKCFAFDETELANVVYPAYTQ